MAAVRHDAHAVGGRALPALHRVLDGVARRRDQRAARQAKEAVRAAALLPDEARRGVVQAALAKPGPAQRLSWGGFSKGKGAYDGQGGAEWRNVQLSSVHMQGVRCRAQRFQQVRRHAVGQASEGVQDGGWCLERPLPSSKQASACCAIGVSHCESGSTRCRCGITAHGSRPPKKVALQEPPLTGEGEGTGPAIEKARHALIFLHA